MGRWIRFWLVVVVGGAALAAPIEAATYEERSVGLDAPAMEQGSTGLVMADVNGDGFADLVSVGDHGSPLVNSEQHGIIVWTVPPGSWRWDHVQTGAFGYGGVAVGDLDGDGVADVVYGIHHNWSDTDLGDQLLEVALGDGTGTSWTPWDDGLGANGESWGLFGVDLADVDNDGDLDVGANSFGCCDGVHVYLNQGNGSWQQSFGFLGGNSLNHFVFGDIDGDGDADFAVARDDGLVYTGDGRGGFVPADGNLPALAPPLGLDLADVTDDGRDELVITTGAGVRVFQWTGDGNWQELSGALATVGDAWRVVVADMNVDGLGDVVALYRDRVEIWAGNGSGGWQQFATVPTPQVESVAALAAGADLDLDGRPDFAFIHTDGHAWFGEQNRPHVYLRTDYVNPGFWIHPVSPRGGETWVAGSVRFIEWYGAALFAKPPGPRGSVVTIELSTDGPKGPYAEIARNLPVTGRHQWRLADDLPSSSACYLRFKMDGWPVAVTPHPFTIRARETASPPQPAPPPTTPLPD